MRRANAKPGLTGKSSFQIFFGRARREEEELRLAPGGPTQPACLPTPADSPEVVDGINKEREELKEDVIQAKEDRSPVTTLRPRRKAQMPKIGAGHGKGRYSTDWYRVVEVDHRSLKVKVRKKDTADSTSWESLRNVRPFYG
ncbi:hypothetical protein Pmar_PMAR026793 [Perkinsus marinus ATCC 50983]|uniref:Uncharacterized protein n=1 Tax=Perkinsus marinus (strain ATCC 50983 / TXsc) TaxID=423536 RepID=C5KFS2_PERM5|nr:hypothetical protein Pmar_PMAR026793 [Perkinsus marinus ATCC 50983]EER16670.1 hypothetical protein Pmar_PMAR026793 [Perkinsus marinus ATCC 50983]|eukprot:XP_002784874.1 hypothetical protein Pmar_PMAR026793 [Perkinsus marinus ATCC 50983]